MARYRRRRNDDDEGPLNRGQALAQIAGDRGRGKTFLQPHLRLLEHRKQGRGIARLGSGRARKAGEGRIMDKAEIGQLIPQRLAC